MSAYDKNWHKRFEELSPRDQEQLKKHVRRQVSGRFGANAEGAHEDSPAGALVGGTISAVVATGFLLLGFWPASILFGLFACYWLGCGLVALAQW